MSIIPEEELKSYSSLNLAPMVDFLFLVVAVFATIAVTRAALFDRDIKLVKVENRVETPEKNPLTSYTVNLSVNDQGQYKWITEFNEYLIETPAGVQQELLKQQELGLLPKEGKSTKILLHIDQNAKWDPIAQVIFAVRQSGFEIYPVYDVQED